jgi:SET and MYND domain-containing protein 4
VTPHNRGAYIFSAAVKIFQIFNLKIGLKTETMNICIENGFETIFDHVCSQLKLNGEVESTSKTFASLSTDIDRFAFVKPLLDGVPLSDGLSEDAKKSETRSSAFREAGNEKFKTKKDLQALELYTRSILFAPAESRSLALAYGNRSAVLKSLRKFQDCILDVDRALRLDFPDGLIYKLLVRQGECFLALGQLQKAIEIFTKAQTKLKIADLNEEKSKEQMKLISKYIAKCQTGDIIVNVGRMEPKVEMPSKSYDQNDEILCASSCVKIEYSSEFGRHVCATRDIEPGKTHFKSLYFKID